jgi:hypothetical protein
MEKTHTKEVLGRTDCHTFLSLQIKYLIQEGQNFIMYAQTYWWEGFMKYTTERASGGMIYMPSFEPFLAQCHGWCSLGLHTAATSHSIICAVTYPYPSLGSNMSPHPFYPTVCPSPPPPPTVTNSPATCCLPADFSYTGDVSELTCF